MKLTCVTAVFNAIESGNRERLIKCVESVASLKTEHEHLIFDGASKDGTVDLLRELEAKTPGLRVVSEPDKGIYSALNKGLRDAQGEWFYVLGCDDHVFKPDVLDRMISELTDKDDILATSVVNADANCSHFSTSVPNLSSIFNNQCACHQGEVMRTKIARALGGFDEQYRIAADSDMFFKAHLACYKFKYETDPFTLCVCVGVSSTNGERAHREHVTSIANVLKLSGSDRCLMVERFVLPFHTCLSLWNHGDIVIRNAARAMFWHRIWLMLRFVLYPLVVISRPIRNAIRVSHQPLDH